MFSSMGRNKGGGKLFLPSTFLERRSRPETFLALFSWGIKGREPLSPADFLFIPTPASPDFSSPKNGEQCPPSPPTLVFGLVFGDKRGIFLPSSSQKPIH